MITPNFLVVCDGNHAQLTACGHSDCWLGDEAVRPTISVHSDEDGSVGSWPVKFTTTHWRIPHKDRVILFGEIAYLFKDLLAGYPFKERHYIKTTLWIEAGDLNAVLLAVLRTAPLALAPCPASSLDSARIHLACAALKPLAAIWEAYLANALDDEARRFWGKNDEHENSTPPGEIELVSGRGGKQLLTLLHAKAAWHALKAYEQP